MTRGERVVRMLAIAAIPFLVVVALATGAWGVLEGLFAYEEYFSALSRLLLGAAGIALLGALLAGLVLLIGRSVSRRSRHWVRTVALVVAVLAVLSGPVRAWAEYSWVVSAGGRFEAALDELHMPGRYDPVDQRPLALVAEAPSNRPYAWRAWHIPPGASACQDLRQALRRWLEEPVRPGDAGSQDTDPGDPYRCSLYSGLGVGSVFGSVVEFGSSEPAVTYRQPIIYVRITITGDPT